MLDRKYKGIVTGILLLVIVGFAVMKFVIPPKSGGGDSCNWTERMAVDDLVYSNHARCRMECRNIDQQLVEKVYLHGELNCAKNSFIDGHQRYALEKRDDRGDMVRIIVADDDDKHVIVTVIRLDRDDHCSCS